MNFTVRSVRKFGICGLSIDNFRKETVMTVRELIELLKKAPPDDIILADIGQEESADISGMLT